MKEEIGLVGSVCYFSPLSPVHAVVEVIKMENRPTRVLLVEDDAIQAGLIQKMLTSAGKNDFEIKWVSCLSEALARLAEGGIDVVLLDLILPDSWGLDSFVRACEHGSNAAFVVLTGLADEELGLTAVRQGAQDYLIKGVVNGYLLSRSIRYALERRRFQEALVAERRRLYSLLDALPAIVYLRGLDHVIRFANQGFRELFGSPEGKRCYEIFHDRLAPCEPCQAREVLETQKGRWVEWTRPGQNKTYQIQYYPFGDLDGSPLILAMGIDITERKSMEEALKAEEQILEDIFNSIQDGLSILDLERRVIRVNPAMKKFPFSEPIIGRKCFEVYHDRDKPCEPCPVTQTLITGQAAAGQVDAKDDQGTIQVSEISSYPLINHLTGELRGVIEYVRDVTKRRRAEEALKDSERKLRFLTSQLLSAQEDERRRLSQGLHDELGHALLAMKLDLRVMGKQLLPEQTGLAENITELMVYMDEVIENVRRLYLDLTPGDLEDLGLTAALKNLCDEFGKHHHTISWSLSLENLNGLLPVRVQTLVYRIFQEILTNIGKHANPTQVWITVHSQDGHAFFEVKDNGKGFDITEGWQRSPRAGMGLLAMEERIRMLGGDLQLWSQENQGTHISFTIPLEPQDQGLRARD